MATKKKLLEAAAGAAGGGAAVNIEDVFSTHLYDGTGAEHTITNGIDLSGEGGMVWIKETSGVRNHYLFDTERGFNNDDAFFISSSNTNAESYTTNFGIKAFNSDGFTLHGDWSGANQSGASFAAWTWRKSSNFFDIVKYTGDRTQNVNNFLTINHNLGSTPGLIIVKCLDDAQSWAVYHRSLSTGSNIFLNLTSASSTYNDFPSDPTDTTFTVGSDSRVNFTGREYIAYIFAHHDGDGTLGPDGDKDLIHCGSYVGNNNVEGPEVNIGFEPQWLMVKNASNASSWAILDIMRDIDTNSPPRLMPNGTNEEFENPDNNVQLLPTGFKISGTGGTFNDSGNTYVYMAIGRGPTAVPTDAADVFAIDLSSSNVPMMTAGFPPDISLLYLSNGTNDKFITTRLLGDGFVRTSTTAAFTMQATFSSEFTGAFSWVPNLADYYAAMWLRAPGFCDAVYYKGNGSNRTINHNLGVIPEMMWVKRTNYTEDWNVYHKDLAATEYMQLNQTSGKTSSNGTLRWNSTRPTSSVFSVGTHISINGNEDTYIAYLFASVDGVSKVGSYTGNGTSQNIDCGFSSGARFVLIKRSDSTGGWQFWDTERGINAGAEPRLNLNDGQSFDNYDFIDPYSAGFSVTSDTAVNTSGASYIFYAIA
jgi:hypothetical protein